MFFIRNTFDWCQKTELQKNPLFWDLVSDLRYPLLHWSQKFFLRFPKNCVVTIWPEFLELHDWLSGLTQMAPNRDAEQLDTTCWTQPVRLYTCILPRMILVWLKVGHFRRMRQLCSNNVWVSDTQQLVQKRPQTITLAFSILEFYCWFSLTLFCFTCVLCLSRWARMYTDPSMRMDEALTRLSRSCDSRAARGTRSWRGSWGWWSSRRSGSWQRRRRRDGPGSMVWTGRTT